ncbi:MAG: FmdE family protein, partial [Chloroflexota bacterium]
MSLDDLLAKSAALHDHLCPRQVLGVRIGLLAARLLAIDLPRADKRLLTIVETDGCAVDGLAVATGCQTGKRTLRVEDYGKVAATFVDTQTGRAIRIAPNPGAREAAPAYAPEAEDRWHAQLLGYQRMPDDALLVWRPVTLTTPLQAIIGEPGLRAICQGCGEEIMNGREISRQGIVLCRACVGPTYYRVVSGEGSADDGVVDSQRSRVTVNRRSEIPSSPTPSRLPPSPPS